MEDRFNVFHGYNLKNITILPYVTLPSSFLSFFEDLRISLFSPLTFSLLAHLFLLYNVVFLGLFSPLSFIPVFTYSHSSSQEGVMNKNHKLLFQKTGIPSNMEYRKRIPLFLKLPVFPFFKGLFI